MPIFKPGEKKPKESPTPSPTATPATVHKHHPAATPEETPAKPAESPASAPASTPAPESTPTPAPSPEATPAPAPPAGESTPTPKHKHKNGGMTSQIPFVPGPSDQQEAPVVETKSPLEVEAEETSRFQAAKTKALQDAHVQELQSKADSATGDDVKSASRRYYKALYEKMREIDPSVKDRIDRTEAATMRRVEQETPQ
jgi:hypothetical protein